MRVEWVSYLLQRHMKGVITRQQNRSVELLSINSRNGLHTCFVLMNVNLNFYLRGISALRGA